MTVTRWAVVLENVSVTVVAVVIVTKMKLVVVVVVLRMVVMTMVAVLGTECNPKCCVGGGVPPAAPRLPQGALQLHGQGRVPLQ